MEGVLLQLWFGAEMIRCGWGVVVVGVIRGSAFVSGK